MQKIACLFSFKMSDWVSCQKIVFNLYKAYALNPKLELVKFNFHKKLENEDLEDLAQEIYDSSPDAIVVMDHKPHPLFLFQKLLLLYKNDKKKPKIVFHVFGDFTLNYPLWSKLGQLMLEFPVEFVVASHRQKHLFDKFLNLPQTSIICPFPVDDEEFHYGTELRETQRKKWGVHEDETVFVFSGRVSHQKKIHDLIEVFSDTLKNSPNSKAHLFIYGRPDDIGDPFVGVWTMDGEYFYKINRIYKALPEDVQKRIHFMGQVPNSELMSIYQGADYLVNLSVHNDEDYGMSVAEALSVGLPTIITDWGGLASFQQADYPQATQFVSVEIKDRAKNLDRVEVQKVLLNCLNNPQKYDRQKISTLTHNQFSLGPVSKIVMEVLSKETSGFKAFSSFFEDISAETILKRNLFLTGNMTLSPTYMELYSSYVRPD